jgi:hypothetical protein
MTGKEKLVRGHRRESALFTLVELQDLRGAFYFFEYINKEQKEVLTRTPPFFHLYSSPKNI